LYVKKQKREVMWQAHMPLKVKKIVCLVLRNRIQTVDNLDRKNWQGDKKCQLCGEEENVDRLIFRCPIAVFMWTVMREGLEWSRSPCCVQDLEENFLSKLGQEKMNVIWILFGAIT
jgi:hypothetical protein